MFIRLAVDNDNINKKTLDSKHTTHATSMVLYQHQTPLGSESRFGTVKTQAQAKKAAPSRRLLETTVTCQTILKYNLHDRPPPKILWVM